MTIALLIYGIMFLFCILAIAKIHVDSNNHLLLTNAISLYWADIRENHDWSTLKHPTYEVNFNDMENMNKTHRRFWDWSYKHILPKEKFAIIEPYIEKAMQERN
jgi:hypothetical protein